MLKLLKSSFQISFLTLALITGSLVLPASAAAQGTSEWTDVCAPTERITLDNGEKVEVQVATIQGIQCIIANVFSIAVSAIGLVGFVMFLIGSFQYLLSGGNAKGIEGARNTFSFAVVGLVVALSSIIILNVIAAFTGVNTILNFVIPNSDYGLTTEF